MTFIPKGMAGVLLLALLLSACHSSAPNSTGQADQPATSNPTATANPSEYQEFALKFPLQKMPCNLPGDFQKNGTELDKKYVKDLLSGSFTPAFGHEDILPSITDNVEAAKYFAGGRLKLDSFDGYVVHKQADDDYYFLCIFDKQGNFTDGTWIAFTEGSNDDGTVREASINDDGSIEISQYDVLKGKPNQSGAERHFYIITSQGKIKDMKENATPAHA